MPSEAEIEVAARAIRQIFSERIGSAATPWNQLRQYQHDGYRDEARAALFAAERVRASEPAHDSDDRTSLSPARLEPESNPSDSFFDPIRQGKIT